MNTPQPKSSSHTPFTLRGVVALLLLGGGGLIPGPVLGPLTGRLSAADKDLPPTTNSTPAPFVAQTSQPADAAPLGLQVGDRVPQFYVRAVTGPLKNKSVCYVCRHGDRPVVMLLVHRTTPELAPLLRGLDAVVDQHRAVGLKAFAVFLASDARELLPQVQTLGFDENLSLPLTIAATPVDGPGSKSPPSDLVLSAVLYREHQVVAHVPFRAGQLNEMTRQQLLDRVIRLANPPAHPPTWPP